MDNLKFYLMLIAYVLTIVLFSACKKTEEKGWYEYAETQCADPWFNEVANGSTAQTAVLEFLIANDIEIDQVQITQQERNFSTCEACNCPTSREVRVKLSNKEEDAAALVALGFEPM